MRSRVIVSRSARETSAIGQWLGERLWPGAFLALTGDLGAGKTVLATGVLAGLGVERTGGSPTFPLLWEYPGGRLHAFHWDVYRVEQSEELEDLGYEDSFYGDGVCLVEWADRVRPLWPPERLEVRLEPVASGLRAGDGDGGGLAGEGAAVAGDGAAVAGEGAAVAGEGAAVAAGSADQGALAPLGGGGLTAGVAPGPGLVSADRTQWRKLTVAAAGPRYEALLEELAHAGLGA